MTYVDGFVFTVPTANKQKFLDFAHKMNPLFLEYGATKVVECWGDEVPDGEVTSFPMAVKCKEDETVCFSWVLWPSKEVRTGAMEKMGSDERFNPEENPMPFDGKRVILGGFDIVFEIGDQ